MFCVIYKFHVDPEKEKQFQDGWSNLTKILKKENGALGSRLHRNHDGSWIAYAQWPDENTWANAANNSAEAERSRQLMKESYLEGKSIEVLYKLDVVDDLLEK